MAYDFGDLAEKIDSSKYDFGDLASISENNISPDDIKVEKGKYKDIARFIPGTPADQPPAQEPSFLEKFGGSVEAGGGMLAGMATGLAALPYGVARDIYERTLGGGKAGVSKADIYATQAMQNPITQSLMPKSEVGKEYLTKAGNIMSSIPPVLPELGVVGSAMKQQVPAIPGLVNELKKGATISPVLDAKLMQGKPLPTTKQKLFLETRPYGYKITPTTVDTKFAPAYLGESITSKSKIQSITSKKNAEARANDIRIVDLGLEPGTEITPADLSSIRSDLGNKTMAIVDSIPKTIISDVRRGTFSKLAKEASSLKEKYPNIVSGADEAKLNKIISDIDTGSIPTSDALGIIRNLRRQADSELSAPVGKKLSPDIQASGEFKWKLAKELEDAIEENLGSNKDLLKQYQDARALTAKTYVIQAALNPATNEVLASKLVAQYKKNPEIFTGALERAAKHAMEFKHDNRDLSSIGGAPPYSPWDFLIAGGSVASGHPVVAAAELGARGFVPKIIASNYIQSKLMPKGILPTKTKMIEMDYPTKQEYLSNIAKENEIAKQNMIAARDAVLQSAGLERAKIMEAESAARKAALILRNTVESQALLEAGIHRGKAMAISSEAAAAAKAAGKLAEEKALLEAGINRSMQIVTPKKEKTYPYLGVGK